jgi:hypothetical protein
MQRKKICGGFSWWRIAILVATYLAMTQFTFAQTNQLDGAANSGPLDSTGPPNESDSLSLWTPLKPQSQLKPYDPITPRQRLRLFITDTIGPTHLAKGVFASALGTAFDPPKGYGPHWGGFAARYGMRMTGSVSGNAIEAGLGLLLGEDPRYFSARGLPFKSRFVNAVRLTFFARHEDGTFGPAYARYAGMYGDNFFSNRWHGSGKANAEDAFLQAAEGFAAEMAANAFKEFWPSVKKHVFHRGE